MVKPLVYHVELFQSRQRFVKEITGYFAVNNAFAVLSRAILPFFIPVDMVWEKLVFLKLVFSLPVIHFKRKYYYVAKH